MSIVQKLSSAAGKRSKEINKELAKEIISNNDHQAINEIAALLDDKNKKIQSDCIEVLYEIGYIKPELIESHLYKFLELISSRNNRMVWGAMIALSSISSIWPEVLFEHISVIKKAVDNGSVITVDAGVAVYANIARVPHLETPMRPVLFDILQKCPSKQLPQYAEKSIKAITAATKNPFSELILSRMNELERESQLKRIRAVLKKAASL